MEKMKEATEILEVIKEKMNGMEFENQYQLLSDIKSLCMRTQNSLYKEKQLELKKLEKN
jgi:hypothetical protein